MRVWKILKRRRIRVAGRVLLLIVALVVAGAIALLNWNAGLFVRGRFVVTAAGSHDVNEDHTMFGAMSAALANAQQYEWREDGIGYRTQVPVARGDFDGDGTLDWLGCDSGLTCWLVTSRTGKRRRFGGPSGIGGVGFEDIDGDGNLDVWIYDFGDQAFQILYGDGRGRFLGQQSLRLEEAYDITFLDVDGDGDLDLVHSTGRMSDMPIRWIELESNHD